MAVPTFAQAIEQRFALEPLGGPRTVSYYLGERFPDTIYNTSQNSHLYKFLSLFLGPAGAKMIRQNYLQARILMEERGMELFDLDSFFGDPITFSRILEESFADDPAGLIPHEKWEEIKAKNARYRNRALDYVAGARAGNTPEGMRLVSKAGLGHETQIVENYWYWYDIHTDDPLGYQYMGTTPSTEELIIIPRRELSRSESQLITIRGIPDYPDSGSFYLSFGGYTTSALSWNASAYDIQLALEDLPNIIIGDVEVSGGPGPYIPWRVQFLRNLGNRDVPEISIVNSLVATGNPNSEILIYITTEIGGNEGVDEIVKISPRDRFHLQEAIWRIKPMTALPSVYDGKGSRSRTTWKVVHSSSEFVQVVRYVTGNPQVSWPPLDESDPIFWIEENVEHESPRLPNEISHHYQGFHNVHSIRAYFEDALSDSGYETDIANTDPYKSEHIGNFNEAKKVFPHLASPQVVGPDPNLEVFSADRAIADYPTGPILVTSADTVYPDNKLVTLIEGIYPLEYFRLPGVPAIRYKIDQFWASQERANGNEYLEVDLGSVKAVNYISLEVARKPIAIDVSYDVVDMYPQRRFVSATPVAPWHNIVWHEPEATNIWQPIELHFTNSKGEIPFTRHIRIRFSRQTDNINPFFVNPVTYLSSPWSVDVKNLIIGRNIS